MSNFELENRNSLFYKKYKYRSTFKLTGAYYANRNDTVMAMKSYIQDRDAEIEEFGRRWGNTHKLAGYIDLYAKYIRWRNKHKPNIFIRTYGDDVSVFTNDISAVKSLTKLDPDIVPKTVEVNLECEPNIMLRKEPKHKFRVYLKSRKVKSEFHTELAEFFQQRTASVFPCKSLDDWANRRHNQKWYLGWTQSSHFMEFDDESMITLVKLYFGDIIGKSFKIEKRPESQ